MKMQKTRLLLKILIVIIAFSGVAIQQAYAKKTAPRVFLDFGNYEFDKTAVKRTYYLSYLYYQLEEGDGRTQHVRTSGSAIAVWDSKTDKLTLNFPNIGKITYHCNHSDPVLYYDNSSCVPIQWNFNSNAAARGTSSYLRYKQRIKSLFSRMHDKAPPHKYQEMVQVVLAKSLRLEVAKSQSRAPADVLMTIHTANDVPIENNDHKASLYRKGDRSRIVDVIFKKEITFPKTIIIKSSKIPVIYRILDPGVNIFHLRMRTMKGAFQSNQVKFKVLPKKKKIPHFHRGLSFQSPKNNQFYSTDIPVKIVLPDGIKQPYNLKLTLSWRNDAPPKQNGYASIKQWPVSSKTILVKPGQASFTETLQYSKLLSTAKGKIGQFILQADINIKGNRTKTSSVAFGLAQLGEAARIDQKQKPITLFPMKKGLSIKPTSK